MAKKKRGSRARAPIAQIRRSRVTARGKATRSATGRREARPKKPAPVSRRERVTGTSYIKGVGSRPASWFTDLPSHERRIETLQYLREAIAGRPGREDNTGGRREPGLRDIYPGFDAKDGYDLKKIKYWTRAQFKKVQDAAKYLHSLTGDPFRVVAPRNKKQRESLKHFTNQLEPKQRRYIVHVESPNSVVRFERGKPGSKFPTLVVRRPERFGGFGRMQYWLFVDYLDGQYPFVKEDFLEATENMLPDMPDWGFFSLWSQQNGVITIPQPKDALLEVIERFFREGESFGGDKESAARFVLQGWVLQGNEEDAERSYIGRLNRRASKPNRWRQRQLRLQRARAFGRPVVSRKKKQPRKKK